MAEVMFEVLELDAVEMFAKFTEAGAFAGIFCDAAFARGRKLRAETGFAEAGFVREIGEGGQIEIGNFRAMLAQAAEHGEAREAFFGDRAIEFFFLDGGEDGGAVQQSYAGVGIKAGDT